MLKACIPGKTRLRFRVGFLIMKRVLSLFLLAVVLAANLVANGNQQDREGVAVPFAQLGPKRSPPRWSFANNSGLVEPLQVVIRDRDAWLELWKRIDKTAKPPEVDFSRDMLIVVAMGQQSSGGFGIIVDDVRERNDRLEVIVKSISPGKNCGVLSALTQPVDIVRLLRSKQTVIFRETHVTKSCG